MSSPYLDSLLLAERLRQYRDSGDAVLDRFAQLQEQTLHVALLREALDTLASRWDKLPERQRPHFSPEARSSPCRPCAVATTRSDTSSTRSPSPASRATVLSPGISPTRAGRSPAGRFSGSARRRQSSFRLLRWRTQLRTAPSAPATRTTCGCWI